MIALKKLVLALDRQLKQPEGFDRLAIESLVNDALAYLKKSKVVEYSGKFRLPGVALKLVDLNMDLDDVIKELVNKRSDIDFVGELSLVIEEAKTDADKTKSS